MKYYAITDSEMTELQTLGGLVTLFVALGTFLAGMSWDISLTLDTADLGASKSIALNAMRYPIAIGAAVFVVLAVGLGVWRFIRGAAIKNATKFE